MTEPTCHTGLNDPVRVVVQYSYCDTENEHVALIATFDNGRPPVELTFDPVRAGSIAALLRKASDAWDEHNYEQGAATALLDDLEEGLQSEGNQ